MRRLLPIPVFLLVAALAAPIVAAPATWQLDPAHTSVSFSVRHLMISNVRGGFHKLEGSLTWDPAAPEATKLEVTMEAASIDTGIEARDTHLKSPDFFDVQKYPFLTFKGKKTERVGDGKLRAIGDLTMHGVTREVVLDVVGPTPEIKDPWGNLRMGASASATVKRTDFGIGEPGGTMIGEDVRITIEAEFVRKPAEVAPKPAPSDK